MNTQKWTVLLVGMTGDLSRHKIIPALYALVRKKAPIGLIIGTGREQLAVHDVLEKARSAIDNFDADTWKAFIELVHYQTLESNTPADYKALEKSCTEQQERRGFPGGPRLAYLAVAADYFCTITQNMVQAGIIVSHNNAYRVAYEKPFGWDLASARDINACIKQLLDETQVFRIDHYLAKDFVSNLLLTRYSNTLFSAIWNNTYVESIKIYFDETGGVEGRGLSYDRYGALKDVLQNHVLQILAMVTMDNPASLDSEAIRNKRAEILRSIHVTGGVLGQYNGYLQEAGVKPNSRTETFAALKLSINQPRWQGVPCYVQTGKRLARKTTEVQLILRPVDHCPWSADGVCVPNILTIRINPQEGISLCVNTKKPGTLDQITTVSLNFTYASVFGPVSAQAYEVILEEIMAGQQHSTVRFDEIESQWEIVEQALSMDLPLEPYEQGSAGPQQAIALMQSKELS